MIRALTPHDRTAWTRLWRAFLVSCKTDLPDEIYAAQWARLMDGHPAAGRLAVRDGRPVGLVHFTFHTHGWMAPPVCYLQDLYVCADSRGLGIGRRLVDAVRDEAETLGAADLRWLRPRRRPEPRWRHVPGGPLAGLLGDARL